MIQENEIVMLMLGFGVFIFTLAYKKRIKRIPEWQFFMAGFYFLLAAWFLTIFESFFLNNLLNHLEHLSYACSSTIMLIWCCRIIFRNKQVG